MVEIAEFVVERGFSNSGNNGQLPQLPTIGPWEGWTRALHDFTLEAEETDY